MQLFERSCCIGRDRRAVVRRNCAAQITGDAPAVRPDAIVDLATDEGAALVGGQWRYRDARIIEVEHRSPGPDLRASGPPNRDVRHLASCRCRRL